MSFTVVWLLSAIKPIALFFTIAFHPMNAEQAHVDDLLEGHHFFNAALFKNEIVNHFFRNRRHQEGQNHLINQQATQYLGTGEAQDFDVQFCLFVFNKMLPIVSGQSYRDLAFGSQQSSGIIFPRHFYHGLDVLCCTIGKVSGKGISTNNEKAQGLLVANEFHWFPTTRRIDPTRLYCLPPWPPRIRHKSLRIHRDAQSTNPDPF
jgi:hypothetical protein